VIVLGCLKPSREPEARTTDAGTVSHGLQTAVLGVVAGMAVTLAAVALGALVFGAYGFGLFLVAPFVIGMTTAYLANRGADIGAKRTATLVLGATVVGGIALLVSALEGVVCIVLAAPLGLAMAVVGGFCGRAIAAVTTRPPAQSLRGLVALPLVFAFEGAVSTPARFDTVQTVAVAAPAEAVWQSIVHMEPMAAPSALVFRLGVAYPVSGEFLGEGEGAMRRGVFSTGTALERVTEWIPDRKLAFVVLTDVPALREISPWQHVHAPHVMGYFTSGLTSFELAARADGGTDIIERSSHELRLEPVLYWLPIARWIVQQNNARVLAHIRDQAERRVRNVN
jgi:hypothetical protein